jgi:hypothetical protein
MQPDRKALFSMMAALAFIVGLILVGCGNDNTAPGFPPNTFTGFSSPSPTPSMSPSPTPSMSPSPTPTMSPSPSPTPSPSPIITVMLQTNNNGKNADVLKVLPSPTPTATPLVAPIALPTPIVIVPTEAARPTAPTIALTNNPNGLFAYVANYSAKVSSYTLSASTGVISSGTVNTESGTVGAMQAVVDPSGKFLYVTTESKVEGDVGIESFSIDPTTGQLSNETVQFPSGTYGGGLNNGGLAAVTVGSTEILILNTDGLITTFTINPSTGTLVQQSQNGSLPTKNGGSTTAATARVGSNVFTYVTNGYADNAIVPVQVTATGLGTPLSNTTAIEQVYAMAEGTFGTKPVLYALEATDSSGLDGLPAIVEAFPINTDGTLAASISTTTIPLTTTAPTDSATVGGFPLSIAVDPSATPAYVVVGMMDSENGTTPNPNTFFIQVADSSTGSLSASAVTAQSNGDTSVQYTAPNSGPCGITLLKL